MSCMLLSHLDKAHRQNFVDTTDVPVGVAVVLLKLATPHGQSA